MDVSSQAERESERIPLPFVPLNQLDNASLHWGGPPALVNSPIKMLNFFGNTFTDTSRNNVLLAIWASLNPVKLTHKTNHHRSQGGKEFQNICSGLSCPSLHFSWNSFRTNGGEQGLRVHLGKTGQKGRKKRTKLILQLQRSSSLLLWNSCQWGKSLTVE